MARLRKISGSKCIRILCNRFGFHKIRKKGSHVVLKKEIYSGFIGVVVPDHKELKIGTLKSILKQAKITEDEFFSTL